MKVPPIEAMCGFSQGDFLQGVVQHKQVVFRINLPPMSAISGHFKSLYGLKLQNGGIIGRISNKSAYL
jgi:hypothetical protein